MERLTMCIDSHLLDNGKLDKEYDLNNKIQLNEYSCMDIPRAVYDKLGELEDVLEKYNIETIQELDARLQSENQYSTDIVNLQLDIENLKHKLIVKDKALENICHGDSGLKEYLIEQVEKELKE